MKKIALITTNKILAQGLAGTVAILPELGFELFLLLDAHQALLDAKILKVDVAVVDVVDDSAQEKETAVAFCEKLHKALPACHLLLLVSQNDMPGRKMAIQAKKTQIIDDFVFYDTSLEYLLAKLAAF